MMASLQQVVLRQAGKSLRFTIFSIFESWCFGSKFTVKIRPNAKRQNVVQNVNKTYDSKRKVSKSRD